jgi:hypothetical protein
LTVRNSVHAEEKLSARSIRKEDVERVIVESQQQFVDVEHDAKVAIGPVDDRSVIVVYRMVNADIKVIPVYHTRKLEKLVSSKM